MAETRKYTSHRSRLDGWKQTGIGSRDDWPISIVAGWVMMGSDDGTEIVFKPPSSITGALKFTDLTDTPAAPLTPDSYMVVDALGNLIETTDPVIKSETALQEIQGPLLIGAAKTGSTGFTIEHGENSIGHLSFYEDNASEGDSVQAAAVQWMGSSGELRSFVNSEDGSFLVSGFRLTRSGDTPNEPEIYDGSAWGDVYYDGMPNGSIDVAKIPLTSSWMLRGNVSNVAEAVDFLNTNLGWGGIQTYAALSTFNGAADFGSTVTMTSGGIFQTGILWVDNNDEVRALEGFEWTGTKLIIGNAHSGAGVVSVSNPVDATSTAFYIESHKNNATKSARLLMRSSRGTAVTPTTLLSGDRFGAIEFGMYHGGSGWADSVEMYAVVDEAPTGSARGSSLRFHTASISTTTLTERMRIHSNGLVGIGVTAPTSQLHVNADITLDDSDSGSTLNWGSLKDTGLYRDSAAHLKTDESLEVGTDFFHSGSNAGFYGTAVVSIGTAFTLTATQAPSHTLSADPGGTQNNNNVLSALISELQRKGLIA